MDAGSHAALAVLLQGARHAANPPRLRSFTPWRPTTLTNPTKWTSERQWVWCRRLHSSIPACIVVQHSKRLCRRCRQSACGVGVRRAGHHTHASPPSLRSVKSRQAFSVWVCKHHNEVNRRLDKPEFPCTVEALDERWRRGRPECWETASEPSGETEGETAAESLGQE